MSKRLLFVACAVVAVIGPGASADMDIAGGSAFFNQSDRFYSGSNPPKDFAFSQFNFSGVGTTGTTPGIGNWATLISPNFVLESNHAAVTQGAKITFETTNNNNGPTVSFTAGPGMEIGNTDLFLAKLTTSTAGSGLTPYAIASNNEASQTGAKILSVGVPWRVGTNNIDGFTTVGLQGETGRSFLYDYNNSNPTLNPFEDKLENGDSGGPSFLTNGNQLVLVGIHWFDFNPGDASYTPFGGSGDTYVSDYIDAINAAMKVLDPTTTDSVTVVNFSVPEPSSLALTALGVFGLFARALRGPRASAG